MNVVTAPVALALGASVALLIAVGVACAAMLRLRAANAALLACTAKCREGVERERGMESTSRIAGEVAHDLNDLLTAITGRAELLIAGLEPSAAGIQNAREIRHAALSAVRLTRPLRLLSAGHRPTTVIDVNAVISRAAESAEQLLGPNIAVVRALDDDVTRVRIGATDLEEIVLNLAIWARDAMPGGGRLTLATTMHTDDRRGADGAGSTPQVRLVVADTADAVAAADSQRFAPFVASEDVSTGAMALAKVEALVKRAGGRIQVSRAPGGGTAFAIDLPATSDEVAEPAPTANQARCTPPVLVVEDEPGLRELIRMVLARAGHEVVAVAGPHAALAALNRQPSIRLALLDVVMPEIDGYDLANEARKIAPEIQVVFMSAFAHDPARHPDGDAFLAKPFTVESLTSTVQKALHGAE